MSVNITSFRQLANMLSNIYSADIPITTAVNIVGTNVWSIRPYANQYDRSMLDHVLSGFRYWRGSIRVAIIASEPDIHATCITNTGYGFPWSPIVTEITDGSVFPAMYLEQWVHVTSSQTNPAIKFLLKVPYHLHILFYFCYSFFNQGILLNLSTFLSC